MTELPVVVVGAGPVGLAAAAHLLEQGLEPVVFEAEETVAASVRRWGHIRLFSPWEWVIDAAARRLLGRAGWSIPDALRCPSGTEWAERYLAPLADVLGVRIRLASEVVGVARRGRDRVVDPAGHSEPLVVHVRERGGVERRVLAAAVVDASGTWRTPNPLGGDGLPAIGEREAPRLRSEVPRLAEPVERNRYAGRHVVVAGCGHSALTALAGFGELALEAPATRVSWLLRRDGFGQVFGGGATDRLPARGALVTRAAAALEAGSVVPVFGFRTERVDRSTVGGRSGECESLTLVSDRGQRLNGVDEVVALTGYRPDLSWLSEIRLELDPVLQAPVRLAPLIDPSVHSCGTVYPHGAAELSHPEPGFYIAGMKSYGRAPTFLARTGYEQVRSIAAALAGDEAGAARVEVSPSGVVCDEGVSLGDGIARCGVDAPMGGCDPTPCQPVGACAASAGT